MIVIKVTVLREKGLWIGLFERVDKEGYTIARHIFGIEPSDPEIYLFVLENYDELNFGKPKEFQLHIKRVNPKRAQKEARLEMENIKKTTKPSTFAQDYMREELEKKKIEKKKKLSLEKQSYKDTQFALKQEKRKKKHKGQ